MRFAYRRSESSPSSITQQSGSKEVALRCEDGMDKGSPMFPVLRRKSSTISLLNAEGAHKARDQMQSPFFAKLPAEVRLLIYEYVAGEGETVHLTLGLGSRKMRYGHFVCPHRNPSWTETIGEAGVIGEGDVDEEVDLGEALRLHVGKGERGGGARGGGWLERKCGCKILVGGGKEAKRLDGGLFALVRVCQRL